MACARGPCIPRPVAALARRPGACIPLPAATREFRHHQPRARLSSGSQELEGWAITAGFVGCVRASIPLTAASGQGSSLEVEELMLTVRPQPEAAPGEAQPPPQGQQQHAVL